MSKRKKKLQDNIEMLKVLTSDPEAIKSILNLSEEEYQSRVNELQESIEKSKKGKSSRIKGGNYERKIAKIFKDKLGIDLVRTPLSGGFLKKAEIHAVKGDITYLGGDKDFLLHIECKNQKTWKLKEWIGQAVEDCPEGKIPIVIFHQNQKVEGGKRVEEAQDYICMRLEDFLNIVDKQSIFKDKR